MNKTNKHFQGSVDDLLNHIDAIDLSTLDNDIDVENAVQKLMKQTGESHESIMEALNQAHLEEVQETIDKLMAEGLITISGYNKAGEPLYVSTQKD